MNELYTKLEAKIKDSYENGITTAEAERLAGEFLHAQLSVATELQAADLTARMRKTALKAVKAAVYLNEATKTDKKPSDVMLQAKVDLDEIVQTEQESFDKAESNAEHLKNLFNIFKEAHIHFRGIAKGSFGS